MPAALRPVLLCLALLVSPLLANSGRAAGPLQGKICYARKSGDGYALHVMDADGKNDRLIPNQPAGANFFPAWSPDGQRIAFMSGPAARSMELAIYLIHPDGTGLKRLAENEKLAGLPAWSPDGKTLLYVADRDGQPRLMAMGDDGANSRELQTGMPFGIAPFFSPDGKHIAFTAAPDKSQGEKFGLYVANPDGSGAQAIVQADGIVIGGPGSWSPDGKGIAYIAANPQNKTGSLHTWLVDDKVESRLMDLKLGDGDFESMTLPCWSPDGKWIVISQPGSDGKSAIWRISPSGKMPEQITPAGAECVCPVWSRG